MATITLILLVAGLALMSYAFYRAGRDDRDQKRAEAMDERAAADQLYGARKIHSAPRRPPARR